MNYDLELAQQYVTALDQARLARALPGSSDEFQHVFRLLPLLLHLNHPSLPGYVPDAAEGIAAFNPSDYQKAFLSMSLPPAQAKKILKKLTALSSADNAIFEGVYAMGSIASISQTRESDLDVWICHQSGLPDSQRRKLQQKAAALQQWAHQLNVEMNLFLMDQQRFRSVQYAESLSTENCGSAQHILLLDEFYRSAIRMAGKPLLWRHLAVENEQDYEQEVRRLSAEKQIDLSQWVDFGGLGALSANEYFGATLWQLYKGIDSPYKAVIKILLLEAYSWEYPQTRLLAVEFKQRLLSGDDPQQSFDPYLAMLAKVTDYLTKINDIERLEFVRRCFYVKANDSAEQSENSWRAAKLAELTAEWQWPADQIEELNQRNHWKIKQVKRTYNNLVQVLMLSYRNLVNFARKYKVDASIMPQDMTVLTRKLYTAFEELPGKVTLLNPQISKDLSETHLTFIEVSDSHSLKKGWYLVNQAPKATALSRLRYVEFNPHLHKLVAWAYFNGLLTAGSQLFISSPNISLDTLRRFVTDLRLSLPVNVPPVSDENLQHNCQIQDVVIAVNLSLDPTRNLSHDSLKNRIQQSDLFSFGPDEKSLVGSVDLIYRNLWNEVRTLHFEGPNAILMALKVLTHKIPKGSGMPTVHVFCYSRYYHQALRNFITALIQKCIHAQAGNALNPQPINMLRVAGKTWQFFFEDRGINLQEIEGPPTVENAGFKHVLQQKVSPPELAAEKNHHYPAEIDLFASEGFLQFFFEDNLDRSFNVYILDELNRLEIYRNCEGKKEQKIREINRIYTGAGADAADNPYKIMQHNFNYPQFYQLLHNTDQTRIVPFHSRYAH